MKKTLALMALVVAVLMAAPPALAGVRHRHRVVHRHVWVGKRIVVRRAVVVAPVVIAGRPHGVIDFDVTPEETRVFVDGELRGTVDDFDGLPAKMHLLPGSHSIRLETPDGDAWSEKVRVVAGREIGIALELEE